MERIILKQKVSSECAVSQVSSSILETGYQDKEEWEREEKIHIREVARRVLNLLMGRSSQSLPGEESVILTAKDLTPGELLQFDRKKILD